VDYDRKQYLGDRPWYEKLMITWKDDVNIQAVIYIHGHWSDKIMPEHFDRMLLEYHFQLANGAKPPSFSKGPTKEFIGEMDGPTATLAMTIASKTGINFMDVHAFLAAFRYRYDIGKVPHNQFDPGGKSASIEEVESKLPNLVPFYKKAGAATQTTAKLLPWVMGGIGLIVISSYLPRIPWRR